MLLYADKVYCVTKTDVLCFTKLNSITLLCQYKMLLYQDKVRSVISRHGILLYLGKVYHVMGKG